MPAHEVNKSSRDRLSEALPASTWRMSRMVNAHRHAELYNGCVGPQLSIVDTLLNTEIGLDGIGCLQSVPARIGDELFVDALLRDSVSLAPNVHLVTDVGPEWWNQSSTPTMRQPRALSQSTTSTARGWYAN